MLSHYAVIIYYPSVSWGSKQIGKVEEHISEKTEACVKSQQDMEESHNFDGDECSENCVQHFYGNTQHRDNINYRQTMVGNNNNNNNNMVK
jgi:hypothetical protein